MLPAAGSATSPSAARASRSASAGWASPNRTTPPCTATAGSPPAPAAPPPTPPPCAARERGSSREERVVLPLAGFSWCLHRAMESPACRARETSAATAKRVRNGKAGTIAGASLLPPPLPPAAANDEAEEPEAPSTSAAVSWKRGSGEPSDRSTASSGACTKKGCDTAMTRRPRTAAGSPLNSDVARADVPFVALAATARAASLPLSLSSAT